MAADRGCITGSTMHPPAPSRVGHGSDCRSALALFTAPPQILRPRRMVCYNTALTELCFLDGSRVEANGLLASAKTCGAALRASSSHTPHSSASGESSASGVASRPGVTEIVDAARTFAARRKHAVRPRRGPALSPSRPVRLAPPTDSPRFAAILLASLPRHPTASETVCVGPEGRPERPSPEGVVRAPPPLISEGPPEGEAGRAFCPQADEPHPLVEATDIIMHMKDVARGGRARP